MKQESSPSCRSVFLEGAAATTTEKYTQLWIQLINQMERSKQVHTYAEGRHLLPPV